LRGVGLNNLQITNYQLQIQAVTTPAPTQPTADWLYGFWYRALRSSAIGRQGMQPAMLLGAPLVIGRKRDGSAFALRDSCPHRGIPLSYGRFDGEQVQCSYHGWCFEPKSGQCRAIPSLTEDSKLKVDRIYASAFPCEERDRFFWVFMPSAAATSQAGQTKIEALPEVPRVPTFSDRYTLTHLSADLPTTVDHGIIGLMDPAHGPFVHQAWWWRSGHSIHEKQKNFEPIPLGFRMSAHQPSKNSAPYKLLRMFADADSITTTIDFILPNMRTEIIRAGKYWFASLTTVTPITRDHCRIDVSSAWNLFRHVPFVLPVARHFGKKFIRQDQMNMEQQAEGLKYNPNLMLIDDADRPAKWYFALKQAYQESQRTGAPFKHPIEGPVTLKWRS
jgi:phenylpropionate dioxygenase-like ring-hydroxylating dioxygenase large terminal subunit